MNTHKYVIGQTGTGKSTYVLGDAIDRINEGSGITFIDPHGQAAKELLKHVPPERVQDVIYIDPSNPERAVAFNPLQGGNHKTADDIMAAIKSRSVNSWGPRLEQTLSNILFTLTFVPNATLLGVEKLLYEQSYRAYAMQHITDSLLRRYWQTQFAGYLKMKDYEKEIISPILNKVQPMLSPDLRPILCQPSLINFREVLDSRKIVICNLSKGLIGATYSNILGSLIASSVTAAALSREDIPEADRVPHFLFADEFPDYATDAFAVVLSEARKYKLILTLIHQYVGQLPEEVRPAIFGNVNHLVCFRIGALDAPIIAEQLDWENPSTLADMANHTYRERRPSPRGVPYPVELHSTERLPAGRKSGGAAWSNSRYARDRRVVEANISSFLRRTNWG